MMFFGDSSLWPRRRHFRRISVSGWLAYDAVHVLAADKRKDIALLLIDAVNLTRDISILP